MVIYHRRIRKKTQGKQIQIYILYMIYMYMFLIPNLSGFAYHFKNILLHVEPKRGQI